MKKVGIIPARYKSSRFPGKPLVEILGKPLIIRVAEKSTIALGHENTYVATDDERIAKVVRDYGFQVIMTSSAALTGTDRLWEAAQQVKADIYINVQGDEPMINPQDILDIAAEKEANYYTVINGMYPITAEEDPANVNIPKVLVNNKNDLIYMSRLPIPGIKSIKKEKPVYYKQVCIYAFNYKELKLYGEAGKKAAYEKFEDIEILRFFDLNVPIKMVKTSKVSLAVDTPEDVAKVEHALTIEFKEFDIILFDFDGVILDSMKVRDLGFRTIFQDYPEKQVEALIKYHRQNGGLSRYVKIRYFFERILFQPITEEEVNQWAEKYSIIMREKLPNKEYLIADSVNFIKANHQKYEFHIVSGSDHKELNFLCKELGLTAYFKTISGSPTPKTTLVHTVLRDYDYQASDCILVGDSINDFDSALANGVRFWGYNNPKLANHGELYLNQFKTFFQEST